MAATTITPSNNTTTPRPRHRVMLSAVVAVLVAAAAGSGWSLAKRQTTPLAKSVTCSASWRPSLTVQPTSLGDITVDMTAVLGEGNRKDQSVTGGTMKFTVGYSTTYPPTGRDLIFDVTDGHSRVISHLLYQVWAGPDNQFGERTGGFTGIVYATDPETGVEIQYSCNAA